MNFYTSKDFITDYPAFTLIKDNWDDYGTDSTFYMYYYNQKKIEIEFGKIKILQKNTNTTELPSRFDSLNNEYISLGQSIEFYETLLSQCGQSSAIEILTSLRDIAWLPPLAELFETKSAFRNSLLRLNSAQKARRFGQAIIRREPINENFSFSYATTIPGAEEETECQFNFDRLNNLPGRIVGIIGRNATGKTQFLSALAKDLVQIRQISQNTEEQRDERFKTQRPLFNRIITVSYSAFDKFTKPKSEHSSYVYCGIRNEKGAISNKHMIEVYKANIARIHELSREDEWIEFMQLILGEHGWNLANNFSNSTSDKNPEEDPLLLLSSGQAILVNFITSLVAWLDDDSLVLFDEPETHLHPNALASLFNVFDEILRKYKSYSIVATHSPLVIQEIPSKRINVFERDGQYTTCKPLGIESFGENISELTRHVFETVEIPSYYRQVLKRLSKRHSFEEVMEIFENKLSMNAQSFLLSQYMDETDV